MPARVGKGTVRGGGNTTVRSITYLAIGLALGFFQGSMEVAWSLGGPAPDLLLLYVLWLGSRRQTGCAMLVGFLGGILQDAVGLFRPVGVHSLCKVVAAYLPEGAHFILVAENRLTGLLLVAIATIVQQSVLLTIVQTFEPGGVWGADAIREVVTLLGWNLTLWFLVVGRIPAAREVEVGA